MKRMAFFAVLSFAAASLGAASWISHGPIGGIVTQLAVAPIDRRVIYVVAPDGVYRSSDAGGTWSSISGPIVSPSKVFVSGADPDSVTVGAVNGVFRSDDGGRTWISGSGLPSLPLTSLVVDPRNFNILFAGFNEPDCYYGSSAAGIYQSTDRGRSFHPAMNGLEQYQRCVDGLALDPVDPDRIYSSWAFAEISGVSRSDDGGRSWIRPTNFGPDRAVVANASQRFGIGYFGESFYTSADGINWSSLYSKSIEGASGFRYTALDIDPSVGRLFLGTSDGAYRSGNGGVSWLRLGGAARDAVNAIDFDTTSGSVVIGTDHGLFASLGYPWNDWTDLHLRNATAGIDRIIAAPASNNLYAVSGRHIYRSADLGMSWTELPGPLPEYGNSVAVDAGDDLYSITFIPGGYHVRKRLDSGEWQEIRFAGTITGLTVDPHEAGTLYLSEIGALERTRDGGATWERLPLPAARTVGPLQIDPRDSNKLLATAASFFLRSNDGGQTWSETRSEQFEFVYFIVRAPSSPDVLYLHASDKNLDRVLARSSDDGQTWTKLTKPPLSYDEVTMIVVDPHDANTIYASGYNGSLFRSTNGGSSWQSIADGLPEKPSSSIAIDAKGAFLHVATPHRGVWELSLMMRGRIVRVSS